MEIPIQNIYYLLSYAWNKLDETERMEISTDDYKDSINLLCRVLVAGVNHLLKKGVDKSYIAITKEYPGIKGRIDFKPSLNKQLFRQGKAICTYDEFSSNVVHNQILVATLRRCTRITQLHPSLKKQVWECLHRFPNVDEIDLIDDINTEMHLFRQVRIHRNNYGYDLLLRVCRMILENAVLNEEEGTYTFRDFTRNEKAMASLFEEFVRNFYTREQQRFQVRREDIQWQVEAGLDSELSLLPKMQTDITLEAEDQKIIIDTKYYRNTLSANYETEKFHSGNLYQIYSYITNIAKDSRNPNNATCDGILLYPTTQKEIDATYQIGSHKLRIATVNLAEKWTRIHDRLLGLVGVGGVDEVIEG